MERGTLSHAMGALLGVVVAMTITLRGAQNNQVKVPGPSGNTQQKQGRPVNLSDEERADLFMARKSYDEAIDYYSRAIKSYPVSAKNRAAVAKMWNKMGICYEQKTDYREARKAFKRAVRLDRGFAEAWNNLGTSFYLSKKPKKSVKFYRRAIKLSPKSASFHWNLGTSYFDRRKFKKAIREYRVAIQLNPDIMRQNSTMGTSVETRHVDAKFYFYMAKIFASAGNASEAVRYLEHAMEEGFNNRDKILQDPDIKKISKDPAFVALMKNPPVAIKD